MDYVLEGGVRRAADQVRITARLIQVNDQTQLWAAPFEGDLSDVLALQIDVAERIAQLLAVELLPGSKGGAHKRDRPAVQVLGSPLMGEGVSERLLILGVR